MPHHVQVTFMRNANSTGTARRVTAPYRVGLCAALLLAGGAAASRSCGQEYLPGIEWPEPQVVTPGENPGDPPSDATVLFDGKDLSAWNNADSWKVENGVAIVGRGMIETKERFGDCQLHIEWSAPLPAKGDGQGRGNSGVFFGDYELQVLDSYENTTYPDGQAGAIYKQTPPMVNAMREPGQWNVYDIFWTAPRFKEDGSLESPAYITAVHNGVVIQNHFALLGDTPFPRPPRYNPHGPLPIRLQDHSNPVKFRNIWVRPLTPIQGKRVKEPNMKAESLGADVGAAGA
ncbi:MAG TPA: DUF1080 domain-containing protein [Lacipirellulaceae bacterium]|nr:DUF1080 domain-containing protein [Lacipirellulaceae bacterium]